MKRQIDGVIGRTRSGLGRGCYVRPHQPQDLESSTASGAEGEGDRKSFTRYPEWWTAVDSTRTEAQRARTSVLEKVLPFVNNSGANLESNSLTLLMVAAPVLKGGHGLPLQRH